MFIQDFFKKQNNLNDNYKVLSILLYLFLFGFLLYLFFAINEFKICSHLQNIAVMSDEILKGDIFLKKWDLSYCSNLFSQIFFYILPVKFFGPSAFAVVLASCLIYCSAIISSILLLKDNIKKIRDIDILFFVCFWGVSAHSLNLLVVDGSFILPIFLIFFLANKFLKTDNKIFLWLVFFINLFLIFGEVFSIVLCSIPICIYCIISFFQNQDNKYLKLLIAIMLSTFFGILSYFLYIKLNGSIGMYGWLKSLRFVDLFTNEYSLKTFPDVVSHFLNIQNANFQGDYIFSYMLPLYLSRTAITLIGFICVIKTTIKLFVSDKENDFISFCLSMGLILLFCFIFTIEAPIEHYIKHIFSMVPFIIAIVIIRYNDGLSRFSDFQKNMLFMVLFSIFLVFSDGNIHTFLENIKSNFNISPLNTIVENEITYSFYGRK